KFECHVETPPNCVHLAVDCSSLPSTIQDHHLMAYSMSQASLPAFEIGLSALSAILDKAEAFAAAKKIDPAVLLNSRLSPDMFDLTRQVQVSTDHARRGSARLAGVEAPSHEDN